MNMSNMPPGCSSYDIPGNRAVDVAWEQAYNAIYTLIDRFGYDWHDIDQITKHVISDIAEQEVANQEEEEHWWAVAERERDMKEEG